MKKTEKQKVIEVMLKLQGDCAHFMSCICPGPHGKPIDRYFQFFTQHIYQSCDVHLEGYLKMVKTDEPYDGVKEITV